MATKDLTVYVKLDTSKAEKSLAKFQKKIESVNKAVNNAATSQNKVTRAVEKSATAMNKVSASAERSTRAANKLKTAVNGAANAGEKMNNSFKKSSSSIDTMVRNIRRAYVIIMGIVAASKAIGVVDEITGAENRLNYVNGYDTNATEADMKKMFNAAMGARTGYLDMVSNVSKSMALAGGAFGGNMDNAIRFQEVMAKAYTIGGASVAEQASSMYQMIQALGAGVLQGDELRSVREGAPLAYQAIEKFAQGVYDSTDSLKEMASQGMITSDIVVAAILDAGTQMDDAFEKSAMTFGQAFTLIKNVAVESFRPVMEAMTSFLNSDAGQQALYAILNLIQLIARALTILFNFLTEHSNLVIGLLNVISVLLAVKILAGVFTLTNALVVLASTAGLPLLAIMAIIFAIGAMSDSWGDAFGTMVGITVAQSTVIYDVFAALVNGIYTLFYWLFSSLEYQWKTLVDYMTTGASAFASISDALFGTNMSASLNKAKSNLTDFGLSYNPPMSYKNPVTAYKTAHDKVANYASDLSGGASSALYYPGYDLSDLMNPSTVTAANPVADDVKKIKDSTSKMADSMAISEEYLKLLRQIAEDSWKRGVTSVNIEVAMNNQATVKSEGDLDGLVSKLTRKLEEELSATASGVYA